MAAPDGDDLDSLRVRLTELEAERGVLIKRLERLRGNQALGDKLVAARASITVESSASEKDRFVSTAVFWSDRCLPNPLGESQHR